MATDWDKERQEGVKAAATGLGIGAAGGGLAALSGRNAPRSARRAEDYVKRRGPVEYKPDRVQNLKNRAARLKPVKSNVPAKRGGTTAYKAPSVNAMRKAPTRWGAALGTGLAAGTFGYGMALGGAGRADYATNQKNIQAKRRATMEAKKVAKSFDPKYKKQRKDLQNITAGTTGAGAGALALAGRNYAKNRRSNYGFTRMTPRRPILNNRTLAAGGMAAVGLGGAGAANLSLRPQKVKKSAPSAKKVENARLRRAKKASVVTGTASGALGVGALGALAATRAPSLGPRLGMSAARAQRIKGAGERATLPLSATSLGVGGVGSLNFARVQNQEANKLPKLTKAEKKVSKMWDLQHPENVSKRDYTNITERQRRAADARRTERGGKALVGAGAGLATGAVLAARGRGLSAGKQAMNMGQAAKYGGDKFMRGTRAAMNPSATPRERAAGRTMQSASAKFVGLSAAANPYGTAALAGAGAAGAGAGMATVGAANNKRHNAAIARKRKARVKKSWEDYPVSKSRYNPERNRQRRSDGYVAGAAAASGAAGTGAVLQGRQVRQGLRQARTLDSAIRSGMESSSKMGKTNLRQLVTRRDNAMKGVKLSGKRAAGLGALSVGAALGADQISRYNRGKGRSYDTY